MYDILFSLKNRSDNNEALSWTLDDPDTLLNVRPICTQYARMCLQISFDNEKAIKQWGQNFTRKVADFWLYFNMDFSKAEYSKGEEEKIGNYTFWLYISSHSNSFGVNFQHLDEDLPYPRFFGGSVQKVEMKTGKQTQLAITSLKEFRHEYECSKKAYYQTLAERFLKKDFSGDNLKFNNFTCPSKYSFLPCTLTFDTPTWQFCPAFEMRKCGRCHSPNPSWFSVNEAILKDCSRLCCAQRALAIVQQEMENVHLKECNFKEYGIRTWAEINWNKPLREKEIGFDIQFTVAQSSLAWSHKFTKVVYKEYLQISLVCLFGIIGGTLGLCVGISLLEFGSNLHAGGKKILSTLKRIILSL